MFALIKAFFETRLEHILADFHTILAKLEAHAAKKAEQSSQHFQDASDSALKARAAAEEAAAANAVAAKVKALVTP